MTAIINNGWIIQTHIYAYVEFWKSEKNVKTVGATLIVIKPFHVFLSLSIELFATQDTVHRPLQIACHSFLTSLSLYISCHKLKNIAVIFLAIDRLETQLCLRVRRRMTFLGRYDYTFNKNSGKLLIRDFNILIWDLPYNFQVFIL